MAREIATLTDFAWPAGLRLPIALTFELQSGEGAPRLPGDRPNYMVGGAIEYGARRGAWNILETLQSQGVRGTFFVCGATAEKFPQLVREIHRAGHEIAGMSYAFERVRTLSVAREREIVRRSVRTLEDVGGAAVAGWRCPDYRVSPHTLDVLSEEGFSWDSSLLNDDYPTLFACAGGPLVELPFSTSIADKTFIGYPYPQRGGPDGLADAWDSEFDVLRRESESAPRFMMISMQAWAIGRPAPLRVLRQFIESAKAHNSVRFARCGELSAWCKP